MEVSPTLNVRARGFAWIVVLAGLVVLFVSLRELQTTVVDAEWAMLTVLAGVSGIAALRLRAVPAMFSLGDTFSFAALFLYGPAAGAVTAAVDSLACDLRLKGLSPLKLLFNVAAPCFSMWIAGWVPFHVIGLPLPGGGSNLAVSLHGVAVAMGMFFALESGMVATAIGLERSTSPVRVWRDLSNLWLNPVVGAYVGFLIAFVHHLLGLTFLLLVVPVPLLLHHTFRTWLGRLADQVRHLETISRSYHSMVEALAIAVDAKDQVTHGHIRRVQVYCMEVARYLGITGDNELKALESAALLHDIGKLGIPERILNKPGRLTPAEFEQIKQHVVLGAHILSTIDLPYDVVPIVRHHHENWDGTGYPDGLSGRMIPIGARVLAVVDCFDALTSDRPYRRRLSVDEAIRILESRRGTLYDPEIVDTFIDIRPQLDTRLPQEPEAAAVPVPLLAAGKGGMVRQPELLPLLAAALPEWLCVVYEYVPSARLVVARHALGPGAEAVQGRWMPSGASVSGWVVSSGAAIDDADGRLDLGSLAETLGCPAGPVRCTAMPITIDGVTAALTLYRIGRGTPNLVASVA